MEPFLISTFDIEGGAARAAFRLHKGLQKIGIHSTMLVQQKSSDEPSVICPPSKWKKGVALARPVLDDLPLTLYPKRENIIFSPAMLPDRLSAKIAAFNPNIVHLHWVARGFMRIEGIKRFNRPILWTFHDMWPFTGGCHYDNDCGRYKFGCGICPQLKSNRQHDLSHRVWERKKEAWHDIDLTIVAPSKWLAKCARESSLFQDHRIEVIPYGLESERFKPIDRRAGREFLSLPQDKKLILFGAMDASSDRRKGFQFLKPALERLAEGGLKAELIIFGATEPKNPPGFGFKAHYMGRLHDDISLALLYGVADVFVAPSIQDNLPNTVMESLACGTPVVASNVGGIPDMVEHEVNGYLAKAFDTCDLAQGIQWVLEDPERSERLGKAAREKAVREYSLEIQARRYLNLYEETLGRKQ